MRSASGRVTGQRPWRGWLRALLPKLLNAMLVMWAAATLTFLLLRLVPGDPVLALLGGNAANPTPETIAALRHAYGFDQPLILQYGRFLNELLHGRLGESYAQHVAVIDIIRQQAGATLQLVLAALGVAWVLALVAVPLTVGRRGQGLVSMLEVGLATVPPFWLALILLAVFAFGLHWFPPAGSGSLRALVLPALAMGLPLGGFVSQVTRESFELALAQPFVLSARSRGLAEWRVRLQHVLRHALLPGLSLSGWAVGALVSGAIVVEVIFARQGLGRQLYQAVLLQDLPLACGITLFVAAVYIIANGLVDLLVQRVDPRTAKEST